MCAEQIRTPPRRRPRRARRADPLLRRADLRAICCIEALAGDSVRGRAREVEQGRDDDIGIEQAFARGLGIGIRDHARQGRAARQDRVHGHARAGELLRPDLRFGFERGLRRPMTLEVLEVDTRSGDRSDKRMDKTRRHPPIDLSLVP